MTGPVPGSGAAGAPDDPTCSYWTPVDLDDRMRAGLRLMAARRRGDLDAGAVHVGWKVGWNDAGIRRLLDLRSGAVGYLTDLTLAPDGIVPVAAGTCAAEVEVEVPRPGDDKLADVAAMLRFVAGGAEALGHELRAGDLVLAGSLARRVRWVSAGDRLDVDMPPIGALSVALQEAPA